MHEGLYSKETKKTKNFVLRHVTGQVRGRGIFGAALANLPKLEAYAGGNPEGVRRPALVGLGIVPRLDAKAKAPSALRSAGAVQMEGTIRSRGL